MFASRYVLLTAVLLVLGAGCTPLALRDTGERSGASAPVYDLPQDAPEAAVEPPPPPVREAPEEISENRATRTLLAQADQLEAKGELEASAAALERALRIEPRNARLWHRLAAVRLAQGQNKQAASFAAKSNSLAGKDSELITRNNQLIREARGY